MNQILIIDDELFFREFIAETLKNAGYTAVTASNGADGLKTLESEKGKISAVLLDIIMPVMDGLAVLSKIKEIDRDLPVIMMTAHADQQLVVKALKSGAFDYLTKPLYIDELLHSTKRAYEHYNLVIQNERKLKQLKNLETGAQGLVELATGAIRMEAVVKNSKLLQTTIDLMASVLEAERVSMMLVNEQKRELRVIVANGLNLDVSTLPVRKVGEGIAGKVAESGEPILVKDIREAAEFRKSEFAGQYKTGSFLCVPIKISGKTIGVISVNDKLTGEPFSDSDLMVMSTFSHQVALTLENAMISADMDRYIEKLTLLNEISQTLLSIVDPKDIFKDIVMKTQKILEVEACTLLLSDDRTGELVFEAGHGRDGDIAQDIRVRPGEGLTGSVVQNGRMVSVDNAVDDKRYAPKIDGFPNLHVKGILCAPLKIKDQPLGVIKAVNKINGQPFNVRDRELMESIASQSSIALKNAWLYKNLVSTIDEVAATNKELERVNTELKMKVKELELLKKGKK